MIIFDQLNFSNLNYCCFFPLLKDEYAEENNGDVNEGIPAPPDDSTEPETIPVSAPDPQYGSDDRDLCAGVFCPEIDCPTNPYIPQGQCCPVCPGASPVRPPPPVRFSFCMRIP